MHFESIACVFLCVEDTFRMLLLLAAPGCHAGAHCASSIYGVVFFSASARV